MSDTPNAVIENPRVTFGVLHEDDDVIIVSKPARVVTQPGVGHEHDTLLNGLFARWGDKLDKLGPNRDFGLVHRLDRETSGCVAIALTPGAYDHLREQFSERRVKKFYWAVCHKAPREPSGVIRKPIAEEVQRKDRYTSTKFAKVSASGKPAVTAFRVLAESDAAALIEARPVTGRLHQVRVHLDLIGSAILGDPLYGPQRVRGAAPRLALHAHRLVVEHPVSGEPVDAHAPLPRDYRTLLRKLRLPLPSEVDTNPTSEPDES